MKMERNKIWLACVTCTLTLFIAIFISSCGKKDDKKEDAASNPIVENKPGELGSGWLVKTESGKDTITIDFTTYAGAAKDNQYVLLPFTLGKIGTIEGAVDQTAAVDFVLSKATYYLDDPAVKAPEIKQDSTYDLDHQLRTIWNRYERKLGMNQPESWWQAVRSLDKTPLSLYSTSQYKTFEDSFKAIISSQSKNKSKTRKALTTMLTGACPAEIEMVENTSGMDNIETSSKTKFDETDYCIVFLSTLPSTYGTNDSLKASFEDIIATFKNVIYKDTLADLANYSFKPVLVVADFSDATVWPQDSATKSYSGAFMQDPSDAANKPVIFINTNASFAAAVKKQLFFSTIAHEMQHAISHFIRVKKQGGSLEKIGVDEGIAHYIEDLFGYGSENYDSYAAAYFSAFPEAIAAFLVNKTTVANNERGAAQSFIYYLVSQKGGVTFENGRPSSGKGLEFLKSFMTGTEVGVKGLKTAFGGEWIDAVSGFLGAMVLDGTKVSNIASVYKVQVPEAKVKDYTGSETKTYGMHFNSNDSRLTAYTSSTDEEFNEAYDYNYYLTKPILHTIVDPAAKLNFEFSEGENSGVAVIRIK